MALHYFFYFFYMQSLIILLFSIIFYSHNQEKAYYISNLDSLIINDNNNYNHYIKNWINPNSKIEANLLYRLSRDGTELPTFHQLCDNKGPATLVLFYLKNGEKIGFFINDYFESNTKYKYGKNSFLFNLNQNKVYKKVDNDYPSFKSKRDLGPYVYGLGCSSRETLNYIYYSIKEIDKYFENASKLIPPEKEGRMNNEYKIEYEVFEMEVFQIIINKSNFY